MTRARCADVTCWRPFIFQLSQLDRSMAMARGGNSRCSNASPSFDGSGDRSSELLDSLLKSILINPGSTHSPGLVWCGVCLPKSPTTISSMSCRFSEPRIFANFDPAFLYQPDYSTTTLCVWRGREGVTKSARSCGSQGSDRQSWNSRY